MGSFTQEDPIGAGGGFALFGYADGDPLNLWDPSGLVPECQETKEKAQCLKGSTVRGFRSRPAIQYSNPQTLYASAAGLGGSEHRRMGVFGTGDDEHLPSCRSVEFRGSHGTISIQTNSAGYVSWGIKMHNGASDAGPWWVDVYVDRSKVDGKKPPAQFYNPHGSVSPVDAHSGAVLQVRAIHVDLFGILYRNIPNGCIIP
jgi:hypothetical protein